MSACQRQTYWSEGQAAPPATTSMSPPSPCCILRRYFHAERYGLELSPLQKEAVWAVMAIADEPEFHFT